MLLGSISSSRDGHSDCIFRDTIGNVLTESIVSTNTVVTPSSDTLQSRSNSTSSSNLPRTSSLAVSTGTASTTLAGGTSNISFDGSSSVSPEVTAWPSSIFPIGTLSTGSIDASSRPASSFTTTYSADSAFMTTASPTGTLAPGTYIFGGTAFRAVVGGNTVTYTSDGQFLTSTSGGITTTFTSGGITTTVFGPEPTGDVPVPVAEAVIGQCPTYDDRLLTTADVDFVSYIVTCGRTYNGTVISTLARRTISIRAESDDCTDQCLDISGCTAFSYTQDRCIFYSEINAVLVSADPAFSAVRLFDGAEQIVLPNGNSTTSAAQSTTLLPSTSSAQQISVEISSQSFVSITGFGTSESIASMSRSSISVNSTASAVQSATPLSSTASAHTGVEYSLSPVLSQSFSSTTGTSETTASLSGSSTPSTSGALSTVFLSTSSGIRVSTMSDTSLSSATSGTSAVSGAMSTLEATSASSPSNPPTLSSASPSAPSKAPATNTISAPSSGLSSVSYSGTSASSDISTSSSLSATDPTLSTSSSATSTLLLSLASSDLPSADSTQPISTSIIFASSTEAKKTSTVTSDTTTASSPSSAASSSSGNASSTPTMISLTSTIVTTSSTNSPATISYATDPFTTTSLTTTSPTAPSTTMTSTSTGRMSTSSSSSSAPPSSTRTSSCADRSTFSASDGSQYIVLCDQDASDPNYSSSTGRSNFQGINPVQAADFAACINRCSSQGTDCSGVTWNASTQQCDLKGSMARQYNDLSPAPGFDSAVRSSGPDGVAGRSRLLTNGDFSTGSLNPWVVTTQESASLSLAQNSASILITNGIGNLGIGQDMTVNGGAAFYVTASLSISGFANFASGSCSMDLITDGQDITYEWRADLPQTMYHASGHINDFGTIFLLQMSCRLQSGSTVGNITIVADDISFYTYPRAVGASPIVPEPVISNAYYDFANPGTQLITIRRLREDVQYTASATLQVNGPDSDSGNSCTVFMAFEIDGGTQQFFVQEFTTSDTVPLEVQGRLAQDSSAFSIQFVCSTTEGAAAPGVLAVREFDLRIDA
ncbi:unnamed protein product [Zymoseptoria tritici ST99CH_1E4]|uniref:Apple domain-containing protein n=1 Tax=Zymoseptoria tritici ST99CH_1E4 TaxID=1276532 RepID=A0A2H1GZK0_ZYMTR|nr:unnamed protein product [Zymoseptoria tritici ST99CH_1E4]